LPEGAICSTEFLVVVPKSNIQQKFLGFFCSSKSFCEQMELHAIGTTGSHQRISPKQALEIKIQFPNSVKEQMSLVEVLEEIDLEIGALIQKNEKAKHIKQAMMQELLTGKVRLI
jgi:type I restriction enzyme S subunit